ncbi:signal peptidase I [Aphanomyces invadans]|uniref:Mitochondrial inner membrane protease subunit n=1 Tax=Aphanomyces invadans TaxID=157072 RepID=A0A024TZU7_9STRA|nr:signal peptidase I [Aphanomyces invadans]ETV99695.1 signal peptidase I [Aphanomyces invadans]RHY23496.1 hypothetical protein DYB32_009173 [Aphanomyces invadans]|eukprot:XP_008871471.1 signal peptidase I [Aphanomyces invadans]
MSKAFPWARTAQLTLGWLPVGVAFNSLVLSWGRVEGKSMQPTLNREDAASGDVVLLDKFSVQILHRLVRGDVVVLKSPTNPGENLTKRLIALEGDWVEGRYGRRVVVPPGKCWVEGDNEDVSEDSNEFGTVPMALIESRVVAIVWPPKHFSIVPNALPANRVL